MTVLALKEQSSLLPTKCALFKTYIIRLVLGPTVLVTACSSEEIQHLLPRGSLKYSVSAKNRVPR